MLCSTPLQTPLSLKKIIISKPPLMHPLCLLILLLFACSLACMVLINILIILGHYAFKHWELDSLAHKRGIDGDGVLVAVLDTGVLSNHVAFADTHGIKRYVYYTRICMNGIIYQTDGTAEPQYCRYNNT